MSIAPWSSYPQIQLTVTSILPIAWIRRVLKTGSFFCTWILLLRTTLLFGAGINMHQSTTRGFCNWSWQCHTLFYICLLRTSSAGFSTIPICERVIMVSASAVRDLFERLFSGHTS
ncbi:hypothetical protein BDV25DRAFT_43297 [Aspergillus avenaceus]|uniref:Uncharacterized protein n=1 Tax=Aspergillus avenaceus TaxID=36643 RepID=A0A5N6TKR5_ASPAV|nr:hypothetical protein BDV25DRAFT_43297 [Aspergillus avenaceus]